MEYERYSEAERERFAIKDDMQAEWAFTKIADAQAEIDKWTAYYEDQLKSITERNKSTILYMTQLLADYFDRVPKHTTKTGIEKYKLPCGELVRKPGGVDYQRDNAALVGWCKANKPDLVKVEETASWSAVKAYIKETGEIPDGVTLVETEPKFEVKVKEA
ncbi:MAG: host-nuclease inhibitor Gam family protein [Clostridia bacterium]|nr:host-nuclease inhibitor Gam family protein [Clostridia bacterium]